MITKVMTITNSRRKQVSNDIDENQLGNPQCELSQRAGGFSSEISEEIIEQSIPGARQEMQKEATCNFYGDDERNVEIKALWGGGPFCIYKGVK